MPKLITEEEFREKMLLMFKTSFMPKTLSTIKAVTGPGRSGAIASVYASHMVGIPWIPYRQQIGEGTVLIIDTAVDSGATLRKATKLYPDNQVRWLYDEPPRVVFWYERAEKLKKG